jgi:hypothetical protein
LLDCSLHADLTRTVLQMPYRKAHTIPRELQSTTTAVLLTRGVNSNRITYVLVLIISYWLCGGRRILPNAARSRRGIWILTALGLRHFHFPPPPGRVLFLNPKISDRDEFLGTFGKLRKATVSFVISVCLCVSLHGTARLPLEDFREI